MDYQCPRCAKTLRIGDHLAGRRIRCPACQGVITVPSPAEASPQPAPSSAPAAGSRTRKRGAADRAHEAAGRRRGAAGRSPRRERRPARSSGGSTGPIIGAAVGVVALGALIALWMNAGNTGTTAPQPAASNNAQPSAGGSANSGIGLVGANTPATPAGQAGGAAATQATSSAAGTAAPGGLLSQAPLRPSNPGGSPSPTSTANTPPVGEASAAGASLRALASRTPSPSSHSRQAAGANDVVVEAKLLAKSPTPSFETHVDIYVYGEALVTYKYEVADVKQGELDAPTILVAHYGLRRRIEQPVNDYQVGQTYTLTLRPFSEFGQTDFLYRSDTLGDTTSPLYYDAGQRLQEGDHGRWDYALDINRSMRTYHFLRNQLKLIVLGDCQGWFSTRARLYFPEENQRTPVALCLTQERSCLDFYDAMVDNYCLKTPKLEWVVFAYHTRWVNGRVGWRGKHDFARKFERSRGFKYDQQNADTVFRKIEHPPITMEHINANPDISRVWSAAPWGELEREGEDKPPKGRREAMKRRAKYRFDQKQWDQWEAMVKRLVDNDIRVLAYTLPVHPATADRKVKDKSGTTEEGYNDQVRRMKEMEQKYPGYFFFYDYNNGGDNGLTGDDFVNIDHCDLSGAIKCTAAVEKFRQEMVRRHNIPTKPVGQ